MIVPARLTEAQRVYLDFVRAIAAMFVLVGHACIFFLQGNPESSGGGMQGVGVFIFFLISGFLISLSVFQKHADPHYSFREYFIDRFCRIYTAYVPALFFVLLIDWQIADSPLYEWRSRFNIHTWLGNLFMMQDFPLFQIARRAGSPDYSLFVKSFGSAGSFWTISIEWWTYMFFGAIVFFRIRPRKPLKLWQWVIIGCLGIEPVYHFIGGYDHCLTMLWMIGMGVSLLFLHLPSIAARWTFSPRYWRHICLAASGASLLAMLAHVLANLYEAKQANVTELQCGVFLAAALFALLFAFGTIEHIPTSLKKPVGLLADYSYSLYLTHFSLLYYLFHCFPGHEHDRRFFCLAIVASHIVAAMFYWLFERHYRALAARLKALFSKPTLDECVVKASTADNTP